MRAWVDMIRGDRVHPKTQARGSRWFMRQRWPRRAGSSRVAAGFGMWGFQTYWGVAWSGLGCVGRGERVTWDCQDPMGWGPRQHLSS